MSEQAECDGCLDPAHRHWEQPAAIVLTTMDALAVKQGRRTEAEARVCSQVDMTYTLTFGDFVEQRVGCPGDGRYMPPGRGHLEGCQHDAVKWVWEDVRQVARPTLPTQPDTALAPDVATDEGRG